MPTSLKWIVFVSFNEHRSEYESPLRRFVETPTVSVDPNHLDDIRKGVELTVETLKDLAEKPRLPRRQGKLVIHGVFGNDPKLPTATVYNHIDVQPAPKETELRDTEPFVFTQKGDTTTVAAPRTTKDRRSAPCSAHARQSRRTSPSTSVSFGSLKRRSDRQTSKRSLPKLRLR